MTLVLAATGPGAGSASAAGEPCEAWTKTRVADRFGPLENLAFDRRGGLLLSETTATGGGGALRRLLPDGTRDAVVSSVDSPGGIVVLTDVAYYTTGNSMASGLLGRTDGTIEALDLDSGRTRTIARGLTMPNGLALLPDGSFVVTRDFGSYTGLTRVRPGGRPEPYGSGLKSTNGARYEPRSRRLAVSTTLTARSQIALIDVDRPQERPEIVRLPGAGPINAADDMEIGPDGRIYVALNLAGKVVRVDPGSGQVCTIASGLPLASSVRFGAGPGWDARSLYVTSLLGSVTRLSPGRA